MGSKQNDCATWNFDGFAGQVVDIKSRFSGRAVHRGCRVLPLAVFLWFFMVFLFFVVFCVCYVFVDAISVPVGTGFSCFSGALDDPQTTLASSGAQQPETQVLIGQVDR